MLRPATIVVECIASRIAHSSVNTSPEGHHTTVGPAAKGVVGSMSEYAQWLTGCGPWRDWGRFCLGPSHCVLSSLSLAHQHCTLRQGGRECCLETPTNNKEHN